MPSFYVDPEDLKDLKSSVHACTANTLLHEPLGWYHFLSYDFKIPIAIFKHVSRLEI